MDWWQSHYKKGTLSKVPISFFVPSARDEDGLSVSRAEITSLQAARTSAKGKPLPVAEFSTRVVSDRGLTVAPMPTGDDAGHAVIPEMNSAAYENANTRDEVQENAAALASASKVIWPEHPDDIE